MYNNKCKINLGGVKMNELINDVQKKALQCTSSLDEAWESMCNLIKDGWDPISDRESKLIQIANYYGRKHQFRKAQEELFELGLAISKSIERYEITDNLIEEIADVENMIEQMKLFMTDAELNTLELKKEAKIIRQLERIEEEKRKKCYSYKGLSQENNQCMQRGRRV